MSTPTFLNDGKWGDDYRQLKTSDIVTIAGFTPTTGGDWTTSPSTIQEALDELASRVKTLEP